MRNKFLEDLKAKLEADEIKYINDDLDRKAEVIRLEKLHTLKEVHRMGCGFPINDEVQFYMDKDKQTRMFAENEITVSRSLGERKAMKKLVLALIKSAKIETTENVKDILEACQMLGENQAGKLNKPLDQHLGGKNSPNLVRVPLHKDGTLDLGALSGTALSAGVQWLRMGEYLLPAPMYLDVIQVLHLVHLRKDGVLDCGMYFDLAPLAVAMDTATKVMMLPSFDEDKAIIDIAESAKLSLERMWDKEVLNYHHGWSIAAQLHSRTDIRNDEVTITQEMVPSVAAWQKVRPNEVDGMWVDFTGYPLVNAACKKRLQVRVIDEEGMMPHFGLAPLPIEQMGRDCDGDAPTLHAATHGVADDIPNLLSRKDMNNV